MLIMNRVKKGRTILLNTATNCTFIASELDEEVQSGTRENDKHIEWAGELDVPVIVPSDLSTKDTPSGIPTDAYNLEVFSIKASEDSPTGKQAFIGFKIQNGNFHFIGVPYTEKQK